MTSLTTYCDRLFLFFITVNNIGIKIVGGKKGGGIYPWSADQLGAYVASIYSGTTAEKLHGQLHEGT